MINLYLKWSRGAVVKASNSNCVIFGQKEGVWTLITADYRRGLNSDLLITVDYRGVGLWLRLITEGDLDSDYGWLQNTDDEESKIYDMIFEQSLNIMYV